MLLMTVPIIGPVIFVPVQAASAWLVDLLARKSAGQHSSQASTGRNGLSGLGATLYDNVHPSRSAAASMGGAGAPTMPASPPIFDQQAYSQPTSMASYNQQC